MDSDQSKDDESNQRLLHISKRMDKLIRNQQKNDELMFKLLNMVNSIISLLLAFMNNQIQFTLEKSAAKSISFDSNLNVFNSVIVALGDIVNDISELINSVDHISEGEENRKSSTRLITSQEQQIPVSSEVQEIDFQKIIESCPQTNFQTTYNSSISSLQNSSIKISNGITDVMKKAEQEINDRKRRFYNNKYNYLDKLRNQNSSNNTTMNAQTVCKTGESITPNRLKFYKKPTTLLQPIIKIKKIDA